jgi:hypothetical protein
VPSLETGGLLITPNNLQISVGATQNFFLTGSYNDQTFLDLTNGAISPQPAGSTT